MFKTLLNKFLMLFYFFVGSIILELVCFHILGFGTLPELWVYDIAVILFFGMLICAIPNYTAQYIIYTILIVIQAVLIYANFTLYFIYGGEIFTFDMFALISEAKNASNVSFFDFKMIAYLILTTFTIAFAGGLLLKNVKKQKFKMKSHVAMLCVSIFALIEISSLCTVFTYRYDLNTSSKIEDNYVVSKSFLMNTSFLKEASYKEFGTFGFYTNLLLNNSQVDANNIPKVTEYFNSGNVYHNSPVFGVDKGNNVIEIMMESLEWFAFGDGRYDANLNNLSPELTPNIYSLIYGDDMAQDSAENGGFDDGLIARNFFAKSKTNISEGFGILGNYPMAKTLSSYTSGKGKNADTFGYSLPSVLKQLGYKTSYVHSYITKFYDRAITHNSIGFDTVYGKNDILDENGEQKYQGEDLDFDHWACEADFVSDAMDKIIPYDPLDNTPFYTFFLNVSSHGGYEDNPNNHDQMKYKDYVIYGKDNCEIDENGYYKLRADAVVNGYSNFYLNLIANYGDNPDFCAKAVNYLSSVVGLDEAVGLIINKLKEYDIYDETTILLYSDHFAYYSGFTYDIKGMQSNNIRNVIEANTIPLIISSPGIKQMKETDIQLTKYDSFCSAYDIVPTILDLLGIGYNENFYVGNSLFKEYETYTAIVDGKTYVAPIKWYYSNLGGIYTQFAYTGNLTTFEPINQAMISDEDFEKLKCEAINTVTQVYYLSLLNENGLYSMFKNEAFDIL